MGAVFARRRGRPPVTRVREPVPGEILGQNYLLEQELGRGGFGVVFKARHIDIERVVAIKVLLATYAAKDPRAKDRFKREAMIAASLDYPNSLRIFDYGETDEGVFYIVMEYVQGKDLGKVLQTEGRIAIPRAIHIVRQVLHAMMEAHARGIVHRDIKPDNVMLNPLAYDPDYVKVMDFGIAKMVTSDEHITQAGITLGTPRYMPIEQLKGERLGPATDLYAVGLVLYEMLVGRPAFSGPTAVDTALAVMQAGPVKVPEDADVPADLRAIIEKAAARHAEDRYQNARAFLEALNALDPELLDVDSADRERFAAEGIAATPRPKGSSATGAMRIDRVGEGTGDFEDVVATQAVSTEEVLSARPPRGGMSTYERDASTQAISVAELELAKQTVSQPAAETSMVSIALATPHVVSPGRPAPAPLLVALNVAVLIIVLIILLRSF